jgi:hypothetical protein
MVLLKPAVWDLFGIGVTLYIGRNALAQLGAKELGVFEWLMLVLILESNLLSLALLASAISHAVRGNKSPSPQLGRPIYIVSLSVLVLSTFVRYTLLVFPYWDQSFGGGRLHRIELVLKPGKTTALQQLGLDVPKDGRLGPVFLISEGADGFLITRFSVAYVCPSGVPG